MGDLIRAARKAAGMTQAQLAAACSVSQGAVSQWETGRLWIYYGYLLRVFKITGMTAKEEAEASALWIEGMQARCDTVRSELGV